MNKTGLNAVQRIHHVLTVHVIAKHRISWGAEQVIENGIVQNGRHAIHLLVEVALWTVLIARLLLRTWHRPRQAITSTALIVEAIHVVAVVCRLLLHLVMALCLLEIGA